MKKIYEGEYIGNGNTIFVEVPLHIMAKLSLLFVSEKDGKDILKILKEER